jgi:hypothetical protein
MNPLEQQLDHELKTRGMSRQELVQRMGYRNISKGLRRLNELLSGLSEYPQLLPRIEQALNLPDKRFWQAAAELNALLIAEERRDFKPRIQVIPTVTPRPVFVAAMCPYLLNIEVPEQLVSLPVGEALSIVCDLYRKHRDNYPSGWPRGKGFVYHRSYDESFEFDAECQLVKHNTQHIGLHRAELSINGGELIKFDCEPQLEYATSEEVDLNPQGGKE